MNQAETLALVRFVKAACPQQAMDEYTPDAWHELLTDLRIGDAREAVRELAKRQTFVSPAEIRAEVRRIRRQRHDEAGNQDPDYPPDATPTEALAAIRAHRQAVGDGRRIRRQLPPNPAGQKRVNDIIRATPLPAIPTGPPDRAATTRELAAVATLHAPGQSGHPSQTENPTRHGGTR